MGLAEFGLAAARLLPPEAAHNATIGALKAGLGMPARAPKCDPSLRVVLPVSRLDLPNPIGLAAGFDKNAEVMDQMARFGFGFVECGTVTPQPQPGNPKPRLFRLTRDRAVINRMGFNNDGLDAFVKRLMARRGAGVVGANVGANKEADDRIGDYVTGLTAIWAHADYVTLNISSPNTPGLRGLQDAGALDELLARCGEAALKLADQGVRRPVFLKVAPDIDELAIAEIAAAAKAAPYLHGLIISNTTVSRPAGLKSAHRGEPGGLSGAPLMALSTRVLAAFKQEVGDTLDLIGVGGIASAEDVVAKIEAGADAVQLYSALVYEGPGLIARILDALPERLARSRG